LQCFEFERGIKACESLILFESAIRRSRFDTASSADFVSTKPSRTPSKRIKTTGQSSFRFVSTFQLSSHPFLSFPSVLLYSSIQAESPSQHCISISESTIPDNQVVLSIHPFPNRILSRSTASSTSRRVVLVDV